jgi:hypothetical protein
MLNTSQASNERAILNPAHYALYERLSLLIQTHPDPTNSEPLARRSEPGKVVRAVHITEALESVWNCVRVALRDSHMAGTVELFTPHAYATWKRFGEEQLENWVEKLTELFKQHRATPPPPCYLINKTDWHAFDTFIQDIPWEAAESVLATTLKLLAHDEKDEAIQKMLQKMGNDFSNDTLTRTWLQRTEQLVAFKLHVKLVYGGLGTLPGWGVHMQTRAGVSWHPELLGLRAIVLEDLAVPLPWQGRGFSRVLRTLEKLIDESLDFSLLLVTHVHRSMLPITIGIPRDTKTFGYEEWRPHEPNSGDWAHMCMLAAESGLTMRENAWQMIYSNRYSEEDPFPDVAHIYWLSSLGRMLTRMTPGQTLCDPLLPCAYGVPFAWVRPLFVAHGGRVFLRAVRDALADKSTGEYVVKNKQRVSFGPLVLDVHGGGGDFFFEIQREDNQMLPLYDDDPVRPWLVTWLHALGMFLRYVEPKRQPIIFHIYNMDTLLMESHIDFHAHFSVDVSAPMRNWDSDSIHLIVGF